MLISLDKVKAVPFKRLSTGFPMLDKMFGSTENNGETTYGMVVGGMYYFFGEPGVGKSRLMLQIMQNLAMDNLISMICQGEINLNDFANALSHISSEITSNILLTDDMHFDELMKIFKKHRPSFAVVDSANMVKGLSTAKEIKDRYKEWKDTVEESNIICALIGQLNQDGSLKGRTEVPHLVDVIVTMKRPKIKKGTFEITSEYGKGKMSYGPKEVLNETFRAEIPVKNRFGSTGGAVDFYHVSSGVKYFASNLEDNIIDQRHFASLDDFIKASTEAGNYTVPDEDYEYDIDDDNYKPTPLQRFANWWNS